MENYWDHIKSHSKILVGFTLGLAAGLAARSNAVKTLQVFRKAGPKSSRDMPRKMVIVVRSDVPMSAGKIASQCSHAAVGCFFKAYESRPEEVVPWITQGQPKVVLRGNIGGDSSLAQLHQQAVENGLVVSLIQDAGKTEVKKGTYTALGIGPAPVPDIDRLTGHLKTL